MIVDNFLLNKGEQGGFLRQREGGEKKGREGRRRKVGEGKERSGVGTSLERKLFFWGGGVCGVCDLWVCVVLL